MNEIDDRTRLVGTLYIKNEQNLETRSAKGESGSEMWLQMRTVYSCTPI